MGSEVQPELGKAAGESLTRPGHRAPRSRHCPGTRLPHRGSPRVTFLFPFFQFKETFLAFSPRRNQMVPEAEVSPFFPSKGNS